MPDQAHPAANAPVPMVPRTADTILAFDFGLRHIGVASSQRLTQTAEPIATLSATSGHPDWEETLALVRQWRPDGLVVGLPLNMDTTVSDMSARATAFGRQLATRTELPVTMVDERLSSRAVRDEYEGRNLASHASAAAVIAQGWWESGGVAIPKRGSARLEPGD